MTTETKRTRPEKKLPEEPRRLLPWRERATYRVSGNAKQRQRQKRDQSNYLMLTLVASVVLGGLFIYFNWRGAGTSKTVSCAEFPEYCVPLAGGATGSDVSITSNEAADARTLDGAGTAAPGVVRGFRDNMPFIGNPQAPIHFVMFSDFACPHCQDYHKAELKQFIHDFVETGQATFQLVMLSGTGGPYSETASQAALCAGEQGAFWEMSDEMFRLAEAYGPQNGFDLSRIRSSADDMGLAGDKIVNCTSTGRYLSFLANYQTFSNDNGVTATPTIMVSYGDSGTWAPVKRDYGTLKSLTEAANANAQ